MNDLTLRKYALSTLRICAIVAVTGSQVSAQPELPPESIHSYVLSFELQGKTLELPFSITCVDNFQLKMDNAQSGEENQYQIELEGSVQLVGKNRLLIDYKGFIEVKKGEVTLFFAEVKSAAVVSLNQKTDLVTRMGDRFSVTATLPPEVSAGEDQP